jgi:hypothetical protein
MKMVCKAYGEEEKHLLEEREERERGGWGTVR